MMFSPSITGLRAQEPKQSEREAMYRRYLEFPSYVQGGKIEPHWMADGSSFWYAEEAPDNTVIWKVDPVGNTKEPLFDLKRLREALKKTLGHDPPHQGLPFDTFTFEGEGEKAVNVEDKEFVLQLDTYEITLPVLSEEERSQLVPQGREVRSPDGRWFAGLNDHNVWLRSGQDGRLVPDGVEGYEYRDAPLRTYSRWRVWSPDSQKLAVKKVDYRKVRKIPIVHWLKRTEEVEWVRYPWEASEASEPVEQIDLFLIEILSKRKVRVDTGEEATCTTRMGNFYGG